MKFLRNPKKEWSVSPRFYSCLLAIWVWTVLGYCEVNEFTL